MVNLTGSKNYIVVKSKKELELAKTCDICRYIIWEDNNVIYIWTRAFGKWVKEKYVAFDTEKETWSEMEKEAFDKLFHDYEELGGDGFMHSTVEPAMEALEVVLMTDTARLAEVMKQRLG